VSLIGIIPALRASEARARVRAADEEADRLEAQGADEKWIDGAVARGSIANREAKVFESRAAESSNFIYIGLGGAVVLTLGAIFLKMK
jgi:hypothetical protein